MRHEKIAVEKNYTRLVAKEAYSFWSKLPKQTRAWLSVEDLVQEGLMFARFHSLPRYKNKKSKFSTFLTNSLRNHFRNDVNYHTMQCRNEKNTFSLDTFRAGEDGQFSFTSDEAISWLSREHGLPVGGTGFVQEQHAVESLSKVISSSSPQLKKYILKWFFIQPTDKVRRKGPKFEGLAEEFRALSEQHGLSSKDCKYLLDNHSWQERLQAA